MDKNIVPNVIQLCKQRGFVYPNSEIYGGIQGFYDYGPLGARLKQNLKNAWMHWMTQEHDQVVPIDGAIITHPRVWEASGHIQNFTDPLVDCKVCKRRFRADHLVEEFLENDVPDKDRIKRINELLKAKHIVCPECGGELTDVRTFNLMVETSLGVVEGEKKRAYLKGEACQTIYLDYENVLQSMHMRIPFGIVQIGKAFRNEITPGHFLYRQKEFEQWDLQWFTHPKEMEKWYTYWKEERVNWYRSIVQHPERIRLRQHTQDELAHYAKVAYDIEYETPFGWKEWEGIHWRGDWDLSRHKEYSGKDFTYTDPLTKEKFTPWIVETSGGVDRTFYYLLLDAYTEEVVNGKIRVVLKLRYDLAPYTVAILPLVAVDTTLTQKARSIYDMCKTHFVANYDEKDSIGKRYRKQDEIGTPFCVTIDKQTLTDDSITIRDRDTMKQIRIDISELITYLQKEYNLASSHAN